MAIGLAWAERTPLIPADCVATFIYCLANKAKLSCTLSNNNNPLACVANRVVKYTVGVPIDFLKLIGLDDIWNKITGAIEGGIQNKIEGVVENQLQGGTGGGDDGGD
jgi:hypothetical protein